jgi:hypothetical protein
MFSSKSLSPTVLVMVVRTIMEWEKLLMGPCKSFFLQVQPNFVSHLKLMWHLMLIMALLVLGVETFVEYPEPVSGCARSTQ